MDDQADVERKAREFVAGFMDWCEYAKVSDKDQVAARELLMSKVRHRHDPMGLAIKKILEDKK